MELWFKIVILFRSCYFQIIPRILIDFQFNYLQFDQVSWNYVL